VRRLVPDDDALQDLAVGTGVPISDNACSARLEPWRALLTSIYVMLRRGVDFVDLGADHFVKHERAKTANRLLRRLSELGYEVTEIHDEQAA